MFRRRFGVSGWGWVRGGVRGVRGGIVFEEKE